MLLTLEFHFLALIIRLLYDGVVCNKVDYDLVWAFTFWTLLRVGGRCTQPETKHSWESASAFVSQCRPQSNFNSMLLERIPMLPVVVSKNIACTCSQTTHPTAAPIPRTVTSQQCLCERAKAASSNTTTQQQQQQQINTAAAESRTARLSPSFATAGLPPQPYRGKLITM